MSRYIYDLDAHDQLIINVEADTLYDKFISLRDVDLRSHSAANTIKRIQAYYGNLMEQYIEAYNRYLHTLPPTADDWDALTELTVFLRHTFTNADDVLRDILHHHQTQGHSRIQLWIDIREHFIKSPGLSDLSRAELTELCSRLIYMDKSHETLDLIRDRYAEITRYLSLYIYKKFPESPQYRLIGLTHIPAGPYNGPLDRHQDD